MASDTEAPAEESSSSSSSREPKRQRVESSSSAVVKHHALAAKWQKHLFELLVGSSTTVSDIKQLLQDRTNVLCARQKIVGLKTSNGAKLSDKTQVSDLKLKLPVQKFVMIGTPEAQRFVDLPTEQWPDLIDDLDFDYGQALLDGETDPHRTEQNLQAMREKIQKVSINIINALRPGKKLLVLDLDYTLFDMKSTASNFQELKRPFCDAFLEACYPDYELVIWSQTSWRWLEAKLTELGILSHPRYKVAFVLDKTSMPRILSSKKRDGKPWKHQVKPLELIWAHFPQWNSSNSIHIDDLGRNFALNPQSGLKIKAFKNKDSTDRELVDLARYLVKISALPTTFDDLKHSRWKKWLARNP